MAKMCPKCSGNIDADGVEEDSANESLCIHEKIGISVVGLVAVVGGLMAGGII